MKDSGIQWIGEIPQEWEIKRIKFALEQHRGGAWGDEARGDENDRPCLRVADFDYLHLCLDYSNLTYRNFTKDTIEKLTLKKGDILLEKSGGGDLTPVGRTVLFDREHQCLYANFIEALRLNEKQSPQFMNYWLAVAYINGLSKRNIKQTTGLQNLDIPAFLSEAYPVVSLAEQQRIAEFLDKKCGEIDSVIAVKEKTNELLKEGRQSIIFEAVTKGLNKTAPMKDSGIEWIGEIPQEWEVKKIGYLFSFSKGLSITKENLQDDGVPCVNYGEIHSKYGFEVNPETNELKCIDEEYLRTSKNSLLSYGDFIFADTSEDVEGSGNFTYLNSNIDTFAGYHTIIARAIGKVNYRYVAYLFDSESFRAQIRSKVYGVKVFSITQTILKDAKVIFPPLSEQQQIVDYLDKKCSEIDQVITANSMIIGKLKEYKQSLIYEAVTGKIEI